MSDQLPTLRTIDWRSVTPWVVLFRTPTLATSLSVMVLGTLGVLLASWWWWLGGTLLRIASDDWQDPSVGALVAVHENVSDGELTPDFAGIAPVVVYYLEPARDMVRIWPENGLLKFAYLLWGCLGTLLIWGLVGGAISRIAVMRLGRDEHVGLTRAIRYAVKRLPALVASALYPLGLLIPLALIGSLIGLVMSTDVGTAVVSLVWFVGLLVTMVCAVLVLGVWFSWPLMVSTVAAEGTDSLDGLSRGFAYSLQRPVHYAFYGLVAWVLSIGAVWVVGILVSLVGDLAWWSVSWGTGGERALEIRHAEASDWGLPSLLPTPAEPPMTDEEKAALASQQPSDSSREKTETNISQQAYSVVFPFWDRMLGMVLSGFRFGLFWCLVAGIYLLLRQQVDETEFDEIYLEPVSTKPLPDLEKAPEPTSEGTKEPEAKGPMASAETPAPPAPTPEPESSAAAPEPPKTAPASDEPDDLVKDE